MDALNSEIPTLCEQRVTPSVITQQNAPMRLEAFWRRFRSVTLKAHGGRHCLDCRPSRLELPSMSECTEVARVEVLRLGLLMRAGRLGSPTLIRERVRDVFSFGLVLLCHFRESLSDPCVI